MDHRPLDDIDRAIVRALQRDGRLSNKELAAQVGLAPSSCLARVRKLRADGVILGFHARVAPSALGITLQALVSIQSRHHGPAQQDELLAHLRQLDAIVALYHTGGTTDLMLHVAVADTQALRSLVHDDIAGHPMVRRVETTIVFGYEARGVAPVVES